MKDALPNKHKDKKAEEWALIHFGRFLLYVTIVWYEFTGAILLTTLFIYFKFHYALLALIAILLLYRIRLPFEYNGALYLKWMRKNSWLRLVNNAEPWETIFMEKLDATEMYMIVGYPHGMLPISWLLFLFDLAKHNIFPRAFVADIVMRIPGCREITLLLGGVNASWKSIKKACEQGQSMFVLPGSITEMKYNDKKADKHIYVIKRKGFLKASLQYGYTIVPVVGVGVTDLYSALIIPSEWFKRLFGIYPFVPFGEYEVCFPRTVPIHNIIGKPIKVEKNVLYTEDDVTKLSDKYYSGLQDALDHYNALYSDDYELKIVTES
ncbi:2-acylglycerol O-acyltransferase 1-like isoform X2 [Oopsacas minuta]|uniref:Acyltransferase n=1 Tax=Oopsacas minuta TaxID=111878 RepID=A0AAV7JMS0_9METZ|nr:2-acylglycerol O-acyltransferase 1-like isoform X2 [Oopsacas minuta]